MKTPLTGAALGVTDSVKRAMDILKDRDLPKAHPNGRQNYTPRPRKPPVADTTAA